ncbi:MAG: L-seryl-tRNA(Ser) seleniumtransferase [Eubacteriales bacterium]|nr:L-seryl-tRNA(Ser) seleniumtransferase [Eubacteriales bacterium]MDN5363448.1 L-seryl-tRNA(Ser) seleniumtransferase [Eubacteriales bacterium]
MEERKKVLRHLPAVGKLLEVAAVKNLMVLYGRKLVTEAVATAVDGLREEILAGKQVFTSREEAMAAVLDRVEREVRSKSTPSLRPVINATGTVLHTNLGRAPLAREAWEAIWRIASRYNNLELDLTTGERGSRYQHVEELLCRLTGAEGAMVVNNNAGAVLLALNTLATGREVVVSRGELIEIGGSFRIPDVMRASGATLVEVGTTNRTHLHDYERAIGEETALLLKVHTSNYRIIGFTKEVSGAELVALGRKHGIPVMEDLGSGVLVDLSRYGLRREPTVQETVAAGIDVVTFSGDKLLGGPQAGIIVGRGEYIQAMKKNPLTRALRVDKLTFAALEATLRLYLYHEEEVTELIPILAMLTAGEEKLQKRARRLRRLLQQALGERAAVAVEREYSAVGGGALPGESLPTYVVTVAPAGVSTTAVEEELRRGEWPVMARVQRDKIVLDVRTLQEEEIKALPALVAAALARATGGGEENE